MSTGSNGFGAYLSDDAKVAAQLRATKAQEARDERRRAHEAAMTAKRTKREADRQAAAEGSATGRAARAAERRQQDATLRAGRGFGRYLEN